MPRIGKAEVHRTVALTGTLVTGLSAMALAQGAQQAPATPGLTQSNIIRSGLVEFPGNEVVAFNGHFDPAATPGRHRHPGTELLHVIEGNGVLLQDGREPVQLKPGMTVVSEPDVPGGSFTHEVRNLSPTEPLRTYIVLLLDRGEQPALPPE